MEQNRLQKQMAFLVELENLKKIYRQNVVIDGSRHENSAEHSWHVAMMEQESGIISCQNL